MCFLRIEKRVIPYQKEKNERDSYEIMRNRLDDYILRFNTQGEFL